METVIKRYKRKRLYNITEKYGEKRKYTGYDYSEKLMSNLVSDHLNRNTRINVFLSFLTDFFVNLINGVKWIQIHRTYTVNKNYENIH